MARKKLDFDNPLLNGNAAESEPTEKKEPTARRRRGRPRRDDLIRDNSLQEGLPEGYTRFSAICKVDNINILRDYAYTKRIPIKEALDEVLEKFFEDYNKNPKNEKLLDHTRGRK